MSGSQSEFDPVEEAAESFLARYRRGERPALTEYTQKHPELAEQIRSLFPALVLMEEVGSVGGEPSASEAGQGRGTARMPARLGEYRLLREVGRGGMGIVYEAVQDSLGRHVALKVLTCNSLLNPTHLERFRREARAAARLHHTNIVPVFGVGEDAGTYYYAMQFIQGQGLDTVLQEVRQWRQGQPAPGPNPPSTPGTAASVAQGLLSGQFARSSRVPAQQRAPETMEVAAADPLPSASLAETPPDLPNALADAAGSRSDLTAQPEAQYFRSVARLGVQVADALEHAHREGILHRDIKPSNLLLDARGTVWVTDFGLAKAEGADDLTHTGDLVGTLRYMAPERFEGHSDPRSDVYSLGLTLYEMLTLRPAFADSNRARLMQRVPHETPPRPRQLDRRIPADLETILLKATARAPADRYGTAEALAEDLRRFLADRPIRARRASVRERLWRWCRRNPAVAALSAGLLLTLLLGLAGTGWKWHDAEARADAETTQRHRAELAENDARDKLWGSYLDQAQARRLTHRRGQRFDSLAAVRKALELPLPPGRSLAELRNEAASALTLPDVEVVREWDGLPLGTDSLSFDGALERYVRRDQQGNVSVRRVADDVEIDRIPGPGSATNVLLSPNGHFIALHLPATRQLKVYRLSELNPEPVHEYADVADGKVIDFSPDNQRLLYCDSDSRICMVTLADGQVAHWPAQGTDTGGLSLRSGGPTFRPDSRQVMFRIRVDGQETLQVRDVTTGAVQANLRHPARISYHAWHPDGRMVATCCNDHRIRLWDTATWQQTLVLEGHKDFGAQCVFTPDGTRLLSGDWSSLLRVWDVETGRQLFATPMSYDMHHFGPNGRLAVNYLNQVKLIGIATGREFRTLPRRTATGPRAYAAHHVAATLSRDGRLLAVTTEEGTCALVDLANGAELGILSRNRTLPILFEESGALLTYGSAGLCRWPVQRDPATGVCRVGPPQQLFAPLSGDPYGSSADGRILAIPNYSQGALLLHRDLPGPPLVLGPQEDVRCCAVSPDGRWVATGTYTNTQGVAAKVWDGASGKLVKELRMSNPCGVGFSPDSTWLVTTAGGCRLWAVGTWAEGPFIGEVAGFAFSPDSRVLAVGAAAGAIRLVNPATGQEYVRLDAPEQTRLAPQCFTPDGSQLIALGAESQALHVWDLRLIRRQLAEMGLDWDRPPYPSPAPEAAPGPLRVEVDLGKPAPPAAAR